MQTKILRTWESADQPNDEEVAGSPWFYISTYEEFHAGLLAAREELNKYSSLIADLGLKSSPYSDAESKLQWMINWGQQKLNEKAGGSPHDHIVLDGVSYGSLRYLKAGVLLRAQKVIEKRNTVLMDNKYVPGSVLQSLDERIEQLLNLAEQGKLSALRPADIFFEVIHRMNSLYRFKRLSCAVPPQGRSMLYRGCQS